MSTVRRLIVCGSRNYTDRARVRAVLKEYLPDAGWVDEPTIVHGDCPTGADRFADEEGTDLGFWVEAHPAEWSKYGNRAGPIRNGFMGALGADLLIAFGEGRGTNHMVEIAERRNIPVRREP